jgi:hypothetical protein
LPTSNGVDALAIDIVTEVVGELQRRKGIGHELRQIETSDPATWHDLQQRLTQIVVLKLDEHGVNDEDHP